MEREVHPTPSDDVDAVSWIKSVLQYREGHYDNWSSHVNWVGSDWMDVPTVREE
jgi:regulation of enolase protein 1 (concanavalin A-like superfamily)